MSGINMQFNATTVAPNVTPEPVPSGIYDVVIISSDEKPAKNTPGAFYYEFVMQIQDGEFKGRKITDRLNCKNPNQQTVDIAYGTLSAICHVTGVMQIGQSSAELHNRPFKVNVFKGPRSDDPTKDGNEVRGYLDAKGNPPGKTGAGAASGSTVDASAFGATTTTTQAATTAAAAPAAPAATGADPLAAALADGWVQHPSSEPHMYKGQEVKAKTDLATMYAAPAAPAAPEVPSVPAVPAAGGDSPIPSWAQ